LSEAKNRFRVRNGEIEIEYEGPLKEVNERYEHVLEWLIPKQVKTKGKTKGKKLTKEEEKRGGFHKTIYTPKIDELIKEGFFKTRKSLDDVVKGLVPKNVPTRGMDARTAILNNLKRKIASKKATLKGGKEEDEWYFWVD